MKEYNIFVDETLIFRIENYYTPGGYCWNIPRNVNKIVLISYVVDDNDHFSYRGNTGVSMEFFGMSAGTVILTLDRPFEDNSVIDTIKINIHNKIEKVNICQIIK